MLLFLWVCSPGLRLARRPYAYHANDPAIRISISAMGAYFVCSFLLSMKQSTFLAATGLYLPIAMLTALLEIARAQAGPAEATLHASDVESGSGLDIGLPGPENSAPI